MTSKAINAFLLAIPPIVSGSLLVLAFPRHDIHWLAWVGLVPLLAAISFRQGKGAFWMSLLFGFVFFVCAFWWAFAIPNYKPIHHALLAICIAPYFGLFGLAYGLVYKRLGFFIGLGSAPFIWVSLEFIRANLSFLALPWPLLAHSQYQQLTLIQFSAITGAYGISFMIVLVNAAFTAVFLSILMRPKNLSAASLKRGTIVIVLISALSLSAVIVYGHQFVGKLVDKAQSLKVSVIQGNIGQQMKGNPKRYAKPIMQKYTDLTRSAIGEKASLIVWPEAATPGFILKNLTLLKEIVSLIREMKAHFIIGSSEYSKFSKKPFNPEKFGNTALFFSPEGKVLGQYLKIRLLPFGETIPYPDMIPWPEFIVSKDKRSFEMPGHDYSLFEMDGIRIGSVICWETAFPGLFREFVRQGANLMVNLTNEGWFGDTAAPYQFLALCVFRAVENRITLVRAANTGISCFIDPDGRIAGRVEKEGKDVYVDGVLTRSAAVVNKKTFYTRYGDIFACLCLVITAATFALAFGRRLTYRSRFK